MVNLVACIILRMAFVCDSSLWTLDNCFVVLPYVCLITMYVLSDCVNDQREELRKLHYTMQNVDKARC